MSGFLRVPYNYLPMQFADYSDIAASWDSVIRSSEFTLGAFVERFESEFAAYIPAPHCLATNSGTDALILALRALGVGPGDEVVTPCNSFYATAGAIAAVSATPVFCDVDERFQMSISDAADRVTKRTKVILPVHWAGASPDMAQVLELSRSEGLLTVEDACMALGGRLHGKSPGAFGDMGAFSMHPLKSLNVMGDGGMVITGDDERQTWMLKYRNHGMVDRDHIEFWGVNMRLQPLQAVVASHMLVSLDARLARRRDIQRTYDERLGDLDASIIVPPRVHWNSETVSLYMFQTEDRDELLAYLSAHGVEARIHYPIPLHLQPPGRSLGYEPGDMPIAEAQSRRIITIPAHEYLTDEQVDHVVAVVASFVEMPRRAGAGP